MFLSRGSAEARAIEPAADSWGTFPVCLSHQGFEVFTWFKTCLDRVPFFAFDHGGRRLFWRARQERSRRHRWVLRDCKVTTCVLTRSTAATARRRSVVEVDGKIAIECKLWSTHSTPALIGGCAVQRSHPRRATEERFHGSSAADAHLGTHTRNTGCAGHFHSVNPIIHYR
jgi:hypothetical protein